MRLTTSTAPLRNGGDQNEVLPEGCIMKLILEGTHPGHCPDCGSVSIHRSRRKGFVESFLYHALFISPYRCDECDQRHLRVRLTKHTHRPSTHSPGHAS